MGWSGKVVDRGMDFLRKHSIPQHAYSDEHYQRESRERGLVAELPDVFRIVFCELLVLAVPIEKKD
jgi:hypothetical protein